MLRASKYNIEFSAFDGKKYICNGLSGTIIRDPGKDILSLTEDIEFLKLHNFVYEASTNELDILDRRNSTSGYDDIVEITLMVHENCNFRCKYCYQDFKNRKISGVVSDDIVSRVTELVASKGGLVAHFYGGEPLLAWDSMLSLIEEFQDICRSNSADFRFFLTSNGSLLTQERVEVLSNLDVQHVKITLDGTRDFHNANRPMASGASTFDVVLDNLIAASNLIPIVLRINVGDENVGSITTLLDEVADRACNIQNISIDYNIVYNRTDSSLSNGVTYKDISELQKHAFGRGFRLRLPPITRARNCKFNSKNSFLFDATGTTYLCDKSAKTQIEITNDEAVSRSAVVGTKKDSLVKHFRSHRKDCLTCNLLPMCGGGCRILSLDKDSPACPPWKNHIAEYLSAHLINAER
ncbi:radical SAM/SPASM domain-containing protein [Shimia sp. MMG029]|uniref:radical SAM/SPASM domain-containing protein n=1 Tax=Shimia sp. MMG029 TaxID=3021978 RepID=UPI0022FE2248|nr:radical SAM protein [Shimia sp. MMG029]MDA5556029.1 radical SAM protein [Shimia sp. MMG029]